MVKPTIEALKIGINAIKKSQKRQDNWQKTFNEMFDGHFVPTYYADLENCIIKLLNIIYNDSKDDTLDWWIYEMDFGDKCSKTSMSDKNGKNIPIKTIEDLYRYLKKYTLK